MVCECGGFAPWLMPFGVALFAPVTPLAETLKEVVEESEEEEE
jgi:hypothetical protein